MSLSLNGKSGTTPLNLSESYDMNSSTASQVSVNLKYISVNGTYFLNAVIATNGTLLAVNGTAVTPSSIYPDIIAGLFTGLGLEVEYGDSIGNFTSAANSGRLARQP